MPPEKTFVLPAASVDQPPPKEDWGTKFAEFRGVVYSLFLGETTQGLYWPEGHSMSATCVVRWGPRGSRVEILGIGVPKIVADEIGNERERLSSGEEGV